MLLSFKPEIYEKDLIKFSSSPRQRLLLPGGNQEYHQGFKCRGGYILYF